MSQTLQGNSRRLAPTVAAGIASFLVLTVVFGATMIVHYRALDFSYLSFALLRIAGISAVVAAMALFAHRYLRSLPAAAVFGAVVGLVAGAALVATAA